MADPPVQDLPALSTALGNGPITPPPVVAGNALQRVLVAGAAPVPALNGAQLQAQFNATPAVTPPTAAALPAAPAVPPTPAALTPAATPQPTAPVATPGANPAPNANVVNPPLPPGGLNADGTPANPSAASAVATGAVGLPGGGAAPAATAGGITAPTPVRAALPTFNNVAGNFAADDNNPEVIRGGQIVPGTGVGAQNGFGNVGPYRDPSGPISQGFQNQQAYAQNFLDQALKYIGGGGDIFERATRGRAIAGILHAVAGQNNEGAVQGAGVDALNQSIAGVSSAGIGAQATEYNADQNLAGRVGEIGEQHYQAATTPRIAGATPNPVNPYLPPIPYYELPPEQLGGKAMPAGPNAAAPAAAKVVEGAASIDKATGKPIVFRNGQWTAK